MNAIFALIIAVGIVILVFIYYLVSKFVVYPFRYYVLRQKQYKYEKIPGHGPIIEKYEWAKSDKEALSKHSHYDFVKIVYPKKLSKSIKPLNS